MGMSEQRALDNRVKRYLQWYFWRLEGRLDDRILRGLKEGELGEFRTLAALYKRLANDGFPVCEVCGETPARPEHCKELKGKRKRRAKHAGEKIELPPASAAMGIMRAVLMALEDDVAKLAERREWIQGERFVAGDYTTGGMVLRTLNVNPPKETVLQEDGEIATPRGAGQAPPEPLTTLIGVAVLAGYQLPPLLRALHPDPSSVNAERLELAIQETRAKVRQLARLVRGGDIRRGPSTEEVSPLEQLAAWEIHGLSRAGASKKEIEDYLKGMGFGREEANRLRQLKLDPDLRQ